MARSTRCVLSLTAASGRPTRIIFGSPEGETSPSTSTGRASMPNSEKVLSLASMGVLYHLALATKRGYDIGE